MKAAGRAAVAVDAAAAAVAVAGAAAHQLAVLRVRLQRRRHRLLARWRRQWMMTSCSSSVHRLLRLPAADPPAQRRADAAASVADRVDRADQVALAALVVV